MTTPVLDLGPAARLLFLWADAEAMRQQLLTGCVIATPAPALRDDVSTDEITPVAIMS